MFCRVRAFTLMELVITMLISAVIISMAYYAFSLFNKQYSRYQSKGEKLAEYYRLQQALATDFDKATFIVDSAGLLIIAKDRPPVYYTLQNQRILRRQMAHTDSFQLQVSGLDLQYLDTALHLVTSIQLKVQLDNHSLASLHRKFYTSADLLTLDTSNHE